MTNEKIQDEHRKLVFANLEAQATYIFYLDQYDKLVEEIRTVHSKKEDVNVEKLQELPEKDKWETIIQMKGRLVRFESAMDLLKLIDRQKDKSKRKYNEAKQRLESFCKHHGIENSHSQG